MSRFAGLPAALRDRKSQSEEDHIEDTETTDKDGAPPSKSKEKEEDTMSDNTNAEAIAAARAEGFAAATTRCTTVLASEHYAGREAMAQKMLGNEKLSAEEIVDFLAASPAPATLESTEEVDAEATAEAAGRKEMKAAIEDAGNSNIDAGGDGKQSKSEDSSKAWDAAYARVFPNNKTN